MTTRSETVRSQTWVRVVLLAGMLVAVSGTTARGQCQTQKLTASDGSRQWSFAWSIATDGGWAVFGDPDRQSNGAIYLFNHDGQRWIEQSVHTASDGMSGDRLGTSVAVSGNTLVAGATGRPIHGGGGALVFAWDGFDWLENGWIRAPGYIHSSSQFGHDVRTDGTVILVGSPQEGENSEQGFGAVHAFVWDGQSWVHSQRMTPSDRPGGARFGWSLALDRSRLAVGAPSHPDSNSARGAVYVFEGSGGAWVEQTVLVPSEVTLNANFGAAIAIAGDRIVVGAPYDSTFSNDQSGSAFVFEGGGSQWTEVQRIAPPQPENGGLFGSAVAISGETLVIGAQGTAAAYTFTKSGTEWVLADTLIPSDGAAEFGLSAAISGNRSLVGSKDGAGLGAAYEFALSDCPPFSLAEPTPGRAGRINRWVVDGIPAGNRVYFIYGIRSGQTFIPGCGSLTAPIAHAIVFGSGRAHDSGRITLSQFVPGSARGRTILFQVVDPASCRMSNVIEFLFE